jgi:enamine deaminase RidA (YjgF/YER057c/UK114 family)
MNQVLQPEGWAKPIGYSNGVAAKGRLVFVAGQIGWNARGEFETDDFVGQFRQCLKNIVAVLAEAGAEAAHITSMTWYFVDKQDYLANLKAIFGREVVAALAERGRRSATQFPSVHQAQPARSATAPIAAPRDDRPSSGASHEHSDSPSLALWGERRVRLRARSSRG